MQIDSNFINDYFDCVKGSDDKETRLGPKRACTEGWITLPAMRKGLVVTSLLASLVGLPLVFYGGWQMVLVGAACVLFAFLYTTFFSYLGLGDVLVLVFFGIIPVTFTTYVILPSTLQGVYPEVIMTSIACGLVIDTLLIVNNYRDRDNDKKSGKMTLIVRIGARKAEKLYNFLGLLAIIFTIQGRFSLDNNGWKAYVIPLIIYIPYIFLHTKTQRYMVQIKQGRELNKVLALTARNILIYGILTTIVVLIS